jgi:hypothetical protein
MRTRRDEGQAAARRTGTTGASTLRQLPLRPDRRGVGPVPDPPVVLLSLRHAEGDVDTGMVPGPLAQGRQRVKLTMPAVDRGSCDIRVDGVKVGWAYTIWDDRDHWQGSWEARLLADVTDRDVTAAIVNRFRLRDLRAELRRRLEVDGPWWS